MGCRGKAPQLFNPFISKHCLRLYAFGINAFRRIYCANYRLLFLGSLFVEFHSTPRKKLSFLTSNPKLTPSEVKTKQDASSSRRVEHTAGSVLAVRDQGARKHNAEMRSIFFVSATDLAF